MIIQRTSRHALLAATLLLADAAGGRLVAQTLYRYDPSGNPTGVLRSGAQPPAILTQPGTQLLRSNAPVTLSVVSAGAATTYQWFANGAMIAGATNDSLILANLSGTTFPLYTVVLSNPSGSVTSSPAAIWPDANGNGIPDGWEMQYFGNLNQTALGDFDKDGVDNLDEYLEGTNPTNRLSFNPRLYVAAARGSVSVSPNQGYFTNGQLVTLTAWPDAGQEFVGWSGAANGNKPSISLLMTTNKSVTATFGFSLPRALDNTNLVWTTTGNELWYGQAEVSHDGVSAAQSGPIVSYWDGSNFVGDQTSLQTSFFLPQAAQFSFWWSVSSQPPDGVSFAINSNVVAILSGQSVPWQLVQTNLSPGSYTMTWTYSKGPVDIPNGILFTDAAWVDQVTLGSVSQPIPTLGIETTGPNSLVLFWPVNTTSLFRLQETATLNPMQWSDNPNAVNIVNGNYQVEVTAAVSSRFYRLVSP